MLSVRKREGESTNALVFRFTKKVRRSGVLQETRKRRFHKRSVNKSARKLSAVYRAVKNKNIARDKKLGIVQ